MSEKLLLLKVHMEMCLNFLEKIDEEVDELTAQSEQFVLNFYDKLNEISVRK